MIFLLCIGAISIMKAQGTPAEQLASRMAQRMKDSLNLTSEQKDQLYSINMQLHSRKSAFWQQYSSPADTITLRYNLQQVENTRDSLYHTIMPDDKFLLYKQKKRNIIKAN